MADQPAPTDEAKGLRVSVVVCTHRRPLELERFLEALAKSSLVPFEVIVVDNTPGDTQTARIAERWSAEYLIEPRAGVGRARNSGARASTGDVVGCTDDDAVPMPGWTLELARVFADPTICVATGRILPLSDGTQADADMAIRSGFPLGGDTRRVFDAQTPNWFEQAAFGGVGNAANCAFRRELFDRWQGFDDRLGRGAPIPGGEENLAFAELIAMGYRVAYEPAVQVLHPHRGDEASRRRRYLDDQANAVAYGLHLLVERPAFRGRVFRYLLEALFGATRDWRERPMAAADTPVSFLPTLAARMRGVMIFCRSRFRG